MKTILILGASSDIGMAYIAELESTHDEEEVQVIAHYRTMTPKFKALADSVKKISLSTIQADLAVPKDVGSLIREVSERHPSPTHLLHLAAGKFQYTRLRQFDADAVRAEMEAQVFSFAEVLKAFAPLMAKNHYGKIVVMLTSCTIGAPPKFLVEYVTCKYALLGLMKAAAVEYRDKGLCINGISPSMVETKFLDSIDKRIVDMTATESPLKRNININEIIAAIIFLMSDDNSYMCGVNLNLSAGLLM